MNEFYGLLDARTGSAVATAEGRVRLYLAAMLLSGGLMLASLGLSFFIMRVKLANLVRLEHATRRIGEGLYSSQLQLGSTNKIDQLSSTFVALDQKVAERTRALEQEHTNSLAALRESEGRYRELFDNAKDAIYVHDLSGVYLSVNRAAEKLVGYNREEIQLRN